MIPSDIAFAAWVPISLFVFWRYPLRVAILFTFLAGWALLPTAAFEPTTVIFPYWILGTCLPSIHFITKASVTSMTCVLGILLFDRKVFEKFEFSYWDLPMLAWCIVPLLSALANARGLATTVGSEIYQILAWGVPYLVGRLYFGNPDSWKLAAKAFVIAGLAYVPICLVEIVTGPQLYALLYGYQPYRWIGAQRYFGFRPIGLLEDGNQLGIWMAMSALLAIWLWKRDLVVEVLRIPISWVSAILFIVTLLCQSGGSIVLLLCLLPFVLVRRSFLPRALTILLLVGILGSIGLRLVNVISIQSLVKENAVARSAAAFLKGIGRGSFGWRLSQDEKHVSTALETATLGSGEWDWWSASKSRPWGLWLLVFGMYGIVGLLALQCLQLLPVASIWGGFVKQRDQGAADLTRALASAILMSAIDNLLNGSMILPLLLIIGGLSAQPLVSQARKARPGRVAPRRTALAGAGRAPLRTRRIIAGVPAGVSIR